MKKSPWNSLTVRWLGLHTLTAEGPGLIPGWGTKIPQAAHGAAKKKLKIKINNNNSRVPSE